MTDETKAERNTDLRKLLNDNPYMYPQIRGHVYELLADSEALDQARQQIELANMKIQDLLDHMEYLHTQLDK